MFYVYTPHSGSGVSNLALCCPLVDMIPIHTFSAKYLRCPYLGVWSQVNTTLHFLILLFSEVLIQWKVFI